MKKPEKRIDFEQCTVSEHTEAFLPSEDEIEKIITETQANILLKHGVPATNRDLAKAISERITHD